MCPGVSPTADIDSYLTLCPWLFEMLYIIILLCFLSYWFYCIFVLFYETLEGLGGVVVVLSEKKMVWNISEISKNK